MKRPSQAKWLPTGQPPQGLRGITLPFSLHGLDHSDLARGRQGLQIRRDREACDGQHIVQRHLPWLVEQLIDLDGIAGQTHRHALPISAR